MTGGDRVASRLRVAASACLVASGLFMCGAGGAIALADPGPGYGRSDDLTDDDSIGDIVRRAFGLGDGNDAKASEPAQAPRTRWGNGRQGQYPGEKEPPSTETSPTRTSPKPTETTKPHADDEADHPVPRTHQTQGTTRQSATESAPKQQEAEVAARSSSCRATRRRRSRSWSCPTNCNRASPVWPADPPCSTRVQVSRPQHPSGPRRPSPCR